MEIRAGGERGIEGRGAVTDPAGGRRSDGRRRRRGGVHKKRGCSGAEEKECELEEERGGIGT